MTQVWLFMHHTLLDTPPGQGLAGVKGESSGVSPQHLSVVQTRKVKLLAAFFPADGSHLSSGRGNEVRQNGRDRREK
jgi:hypothetical protein